MLIQLIECISNLQKAFDKIHHQRLKKEKKKKKWNCHRAVAQILPRTYSWLKDGGRAE